MARKPKRSKTADAEAWVLSLVELTKHMPRGPQNETAVLRLIAQHTDEPAEVLIFLTGLADS